MPLSYNLPNGKVLHLAQDILTVFRMIAKALSPFLRLANPLERFYEDSGDN